MPPQTGKEAKKGEIETDSDTIYDNDSFYNKGES